MKCFISKNYRHIESAGDKAKTDIEAVMLAKGYRNIGLAQKRSKNAVKAYVETLASVLRGVFRIKSGDMVVVQYPLKKYYDFVVRRAVGRGATVVTVIHDLGSFRRKKLTVAEEIERLNLSSVVIVHSEAMRDWLRSNGLTSEMVVLNLFDYLSDRQACVGHVYDPMHPQLMFAGNCSVAANGWIYDLAAAQPGVDLVIYGGGFDRTRSRDNIKAMGYTDSDALIAGAKGDFGVVWYGSSLDEGAGSLGEYLKYNAPHKTSLYLRAGLPVVIWDQAALADVVRRLGVGLCVPSLRDIGSVLAGVSPEDYAAMRANAADVAKRLAAGCFISEALDEAERLIGGASEKH